MKLERLRQDLIRARQNALQWQARAKDIEKRIREGENQEIVQAVREIVATPEELAQVLASIRAMKEPQIRQMETGVKEESGYEE